MIVLKFGGTSLADAPHIETIAEIVRDTDDDRPVVVVSAHAGVTDLLISLADHALKEKVVKPLSELRVACYYGCLLSRPAEIAFDDPEQPMIMERILEAAEIAKKKGAQIMGIGLLPKAMRKPARRTRTNPMRSR